MLSYGHGGGEFERKVRCVAGVLMPYLIAERVQGGLGMDPLTRQYQETKTFLVGQGIEELVLSEAEAMASANAAAEARNLAGSDSGKALRAAFDTGGNAMAELFANNGHAMRVLGTIYSDALTNAKTLLGRSW